MAVEKLARGAALRTRAIGQPLAVDASNGLAPGVLLRITSGATALLLMSFSTMPGGLVLVI